MMEDNFEDMESGDIDAQAEEYLNTFEIDMQRKYDQRNVQYANAQAMPPGAFDQQLAGLAK